MAAADLQYLFAVEIRLRCRAVVELDAEPVGLIGRRQRQGHRRVLLVAVVEAREVFRIEPAAQKGVPVVVRQCFVQPGADVVDVVRGSDGHGGEYARGFARQGSRQRSWWAFAVSCAPNTSDKSGRSLLPMTRTSPDGNLPPPFDSNE